MRKLDRKLFLIVKKDRKEHAWQFPQGLKEPSENALRATAEREFAEECGKNVNVFFNGNAPVHFYTYSYPQEVQKQLNSYGAKVFFFYAYYIKGNIELNPKELIDYRWVTKEEMKEYFEPDFYNHIKEVLPSFIYDEIKIIN